MKIKDKVIKHEKIEWRKLEWYQPKELKVSTKEQIEKLKASIKSNDFIDAFDVCYDWRPKKKGKILILDGCRRDIALRELDDEGVQIPLTLSAVFYDIKNEKEAQKIVMLRQSSYGKIDSDFAIEWLDIDIDELAVEVDIPEIDFEESQIPDYKDKEISEGDIITENECPKCGYKF